ncbi:MAG: aminotransferase class V-fold PLP-dependent enzyme, partial [Candidatus Helarchaeota archaeon]
VIRAINQFYETNGAVIKRGTYRLTVEATELFQKARAQIAEFFYVSSTEISFVPNESYGITSLLYSLRWEKKNQIITSLLEHHSNYLPILYLAKHFNLKIDYLTHTTEGQISHEVLNELITSDTKLISLTYSPLLFGTITPIKEIVKIAHEQNIPVLIDGTRIAGHRPINLKSLDCDFFVCHGNIGLMGPMGVGILYINQDTEIEINPLILGSGTVSKVTTEDYKLMNYPDNFEPGSPNVANVVGLGAAIEYLKRIGLSNIQRQEKMLVELMIKELRNVEKITLYGPLDASQKIGIVSFNVEELNAHDLAMYLDEVANIAVRSGLLCSHPMLDAFKIPGVVQASLHVYNTKEEVLQFLETVQTIVKELT